MAEAGAAERLARLEAKVAALPAALQPRVREPLLAVLRRHADTAHELEAVAEALAGWCAEAAIKAEPGAAAAAPAATAAPAPAPAVKAERASPAWCTLAAQSFVVPRGSFDVALLSDGSVALESKAQTLLVPAGGISCALELPLPNQDGVRVLLALREPLAVGKQSLSALLLTPKPSPKSKQLSCVVAGVAGGAGDVLSDEPVAVWERVLAMLPKPVRLGKPAPEVFKSSKGKHGLPCYHGVEDGFLFPLKEGMVFIHRPTLFLPTAQIARIDLSRGASGFGHGARNFDFVIETVDGDQHVIKMVEKEEYGCIMGYVERARINDPKRARAGVAGGEGGDAHDGDQAQGEGEEEEEDEDDSSFADSSSEGGGAQEGEGAVEGDAGEHDGSGGDEDEEEEEEEEEEDDDDSDESSDEDRESDIDDDDVDLSAPLKRDNEITLGIIETVRKRRRGEAVATVALDP